MSGSPQEAIDLNELHASKTQSTLRTKVLEPSNTDLASASIQSISVVRMSARPERRDISKAFRAFTQKSGNTTESKGLNKGTAKSGASHGVFKNPFFRYEGNIFERFIALIANLLKVFELSLLRVLKPTPAPKPQPSVAKPKRRGPDGREIEEGAEELSQSKEEPLIPHRK